MDLLLKWINVNLVRTKHIFCTIKVDLESDFKSLQPKTSYILRS